jgi:hypothetical protein
MMPLALIALAVVICTAPGITANRDDLVLVSAASSSEHREERIPKRKLQASVVSAADQASMLAAHNNERAIVSPPAVTPLPALIWDESEALQAKTLAQSCVFSHDRNGQNLAVKGNSAFTGLALEGSLVIAGNVRSINMFVMFDIVMAYLLRRFNSGSMNALTTVLSGALVKAFHLRITSVLAVTTHRWYGRPP